MPSPQGFSVGSLTHCRSSNVQTRSQRSVPLKRPRSRQVAPSSSAPSQSSPTSTTPLPSARLRAIAQRSPPTSLGIDPAPQATAGVERARRCLTRAAARARQLGARASEARAATLLATIGRSGSA
jgi:hypothetical protein